MWASVRIRLLLTMATVVLVVVGTIALMANQTVQAEFVRYVEQDEARYRDLVRLVGGYTRQDADTTQAQLAGVALTYGERILLASREGQVLADSQGEMVGTDLRSLPTGAAMVIFVGEPPTRASVDAMPAMPLPEDLMISVPMNLASFGPTGILGSVEWSMTRPAPTESGVPMYISTRVGDNAPIDDPIQTVFINSVTHSLWLAVATASVAAIGLTFVLSRGIVAPIEALTRAAIQMEKGDLSQRVAISGRDEIGQLAHAFNAMASGLAQLELGRRQMVTDVAHELRTPLSNIRGYLEAVQDGVTTPNPAVIASLHEEAMTLSRLVDDLQDLALAEAHQLKLVRQETALKPLIERVVHSTQGLGTTTTPIRVEVEAELPALPIDPERISQVVRNLLTNALRYTPTHGEIAVSGRATSDGVELAVRDTGSGIAPEHVPHLFDRFYRADPARARATGGSGLGLAIVKQLVELHGGRVGVESEVGKGSRFTVWLPAVDGGQ